jgi:hypothetical protein
MNRKELAFEMYPKDMWGNYEQRIDWPEYLRMADVALEMLAPKAQKDQPPKVPDREMVFLAYWNEHHEWAFDPHGLYEKNAKKHFLAGYDRALVLGASNALAELIVKSRALVGKPE